MFLASVRIAAQDCRGYVCTTKVLGCLLQEGIHIGSLYTDEMLNEVV